MGAALDDAPTEEIMDGLAILEKLFDLGTPGLDELLQRLADDLCAAASDCKRRLLSEAQMEVLKSREIRVMYDRTRPIVQRLRSRPCLGQGP